MKIVEIIHVRHTGGKMESLSDMIRNSIQYRDEAGDVTIYRRDRLGSDLAVHIQRDAGSEKEGPSQLGLRLASALKAFGLVEHTVWKEMK